MAFTSGYQFLVLEHPTAPLDLWQVKVLYEAFAELAAKTTTQSIRKESDFAAISKLPVDASYYVVLRNRVGPHQETKRVNLAREYGIVGHFEPVYTSRVVMWEPADIETARDMIQDLQNEFIEARKKGIMPQGQERCRVL
jgi:hypothetical protein